MFLLQVYSIKDAGEELNKINNTLSNSNNDWEKRVVAVSFLAPSVVVQH